MAKLQGLLYRTYQNRPPFLGRNACQAGCLARLNVAVEQRMTGLKIEGCQASCPHAMLCHQFLPTTTATLSIIIIVTATLSIIIIGTAILKHHHHHHHHHHLQLLPLRTRSQLGAHRFKQLPSCKPVPHPATCDVQLSQIAVHDICAGLPGSVLQQQSLEV